MTREDLAREKVRVLRGLLAGLEEAGTAVDHVQALRLVRDVADSALADAVVWARVRGATWEELGRWMSITRQSAHARYVDLEP